MKEGVVKFKNFKRKEKVPFTIYGDFECINTPWNDVKGGTKQYQKHVPCGFCFQVVCGFDESIHFDPVLLRARSSEEDVAKIFVEMIEDEIRALDRRFGTPKKMILSEEDKKKFEESKLSGYDSHIFISQLRENKGKVKAIPNTDEKYISFSKNLLLRTFEDEKGKEKRNSLHRQFQVHGLPSRRSSFESLPRAFRVSGKKLWRKTQASFQERKLPL